MKIRTRLLLLLLPPLILFIVLISLFFFFKWKSEITESFRANVRSIVTTVAMMVDPKEIEWIKEHRNDASLTESSTYEKNHNLFKRLKGKLPVDNLYIVSIEPVKQGEPVLLDKPVSETNKVYDGVSIENAYRQVYLIDSSAPLNAPPYQDFSESNEYLLYFSQSPIVTPIYKGKGLGQEFMTGYAPILNKTKEVVALVGADVNLNLFNKLLKNALLVMLLTAFGTIALVIISVVFIANKFVEPVSELKNAALGLAAGEYDEKISVKGPREIVELSNTFNTMRECLLDHINRLRSSSFAREKLLGEQECALLFQSRMLDGVIDRWQDSRLLIRHIAPSLASITKPLHLLTSSEKGAEITLKESQKEGIEGIYSLLTEADDPSGTITAEINFQDRKVSFENNRMPLPLLWSSQENRFLPETESYPFNPDDILILFNQEFHAAFPHRQIVREFLAKVLRQFSKETFDLMNAMLTSELNFWMKKQHNPRNVHLICIKRK